MHAVIRHYQVDPADVEATVERAREFALIVSRTPGFVSYGLSDVGGGRAFTVSLFETKEQAEESTRLAADWVRQNLAGIVAPPTVLAGKVRVRVVGPSKPVYNVLRVYRVDPANVDEVVRRAEAGFGPLEGAPGLAWYAVLDAGDGTIASLSGFATRAPVESSVQLADDRVRADLAELTAGPPDVVAGPVRVFAAATYDRPGRSRLRPQRAARAQRILVESKG